MGFFDFFKHKELTEIALLKKDLEIAKEKEERLSSEIAAIRSRCLELSKYEEIANIEKEKDSTISFINEQNLKFEQEKQQYINEIVSLKDKITSLSEEAEQKGHKSSNWMRLFFYKSLECILSSMILRIRKNIRRD